MSTTRIQTTNQSQNSALQFAPTGMSAYNSLIPQGQMVLADYMKDPFKASYFQNQLGMSDQYVRNVGQRNMQNVLTNAVASGWGSGNMPGFMQSQVNRTGRATGAMQSNNMMNLLLGAEGNRRWATGSSMAFQPLVTGQKSTGNSTTKDSTSGLGTWLPQVIGAAAGFAAGGMGAAAGGGFSASAGLKGMLGGGGSSGGGGGSGSMSPGWMSPFMMPYGGVTPNYGGSGGGSGYWNWSPQTSRNRDTVGI